MIQNGHDAMDLLHEWLGNDQPVHHFGNEAVQRSRGISGDYGMVLRDLVADVRSTVDLPVSTDQNVYAKLCRDLQEVMRFPAGPVVNPDYTRWVMRQITDKEFREEIDWMDLADWAFPELDENGMEK